jgi:3-oxoadipate enol-lactonase
MSEGMAPAEGGRLYYEERGEGPGVVLIHAGLWDSRIWDAQMEPFAERHRVVRYDLRGFGRSEWPSVPFSFRQDVADVMAHAGLTRAALVGASIGGGLAIDVALERPELVTALVLIAPGLSGDDTPDDERTASLMAQAEEATKAGDLDRAVDISLQVWTPLRTDPEVDRRIREIALDNRHVDTLDWSVVRRMDPPGAGRLGEIRVPTLVVAGDQDAPVIEIISDKIVAGIPGATKVVIEGADHLPNMRRPDEFNRVVLDFLATIEHAG